MHLFDLITVNDYTIKIPHELTMGMSEAFLYLQHTWSQAEGVPEPVQGIRSTLALLAIGIHGFDAPDRLKGLSWPAMETNADYMARIKVVRQLPPKVAQELAHEISQRLFVTEEEEAELKKQSGSSVG